MKSSDMAWEDKFPPLNLWNYPDFFPDLFAVGGGLGLLPHSEERIKEILYGRLDEDTNVV